MRRLWIALVLAAALAVACTGDGAPPERTTGPEPTAATGDAPLGPGGAITGSAAKALERLCSVEILKPGREDTSVPAEGPTPPAIEQVMGELEEVRGFAFEHPVVAEPVTQADIARGFRESLDAGFPVDLSERRSAAWQTIGVIDPGVDIRTDLMRFGSSQVIGYYDTQSEELVFLGGEDPTPLESVTLAHELTHAIDDQRFGLERVDRLNARCRDDASSAALGLIEGNATFFMYEWARQFLTPEEQIELVEEAGEQQPPSSGIAPFIEALQTWPYTEGLRFVTELEQRGGVDAIDEAFGDLPVSSEQIIHPERYPNDVPTPLDIEDLSGQLGDGWRDLDVMEVGEVWLDTALALGLQEGVPGAASEGWDGGLYRAWTNEDGDVALVLRTAWDSEGDAEEFGRALQRWIEDRPGDVLPVEGTTVDAIFASDAETLGAVEDALA